MTKENITDETPHSLKLKMRHSLGETLFHVVYGLSITLVRTCATLIDIVIPKNRLRCVHRAPQYEVDFLVPVPWFRYIFYSALSAPSFLSSYYSP